MDSVTYWFHNYIGFNKLRLSFSANYKVYELVKEIPSIVNVFKPRYYNTIYLKVETGYCGLLKVRQSTLVNYLANGDGIQHRAIWNV